MTRAATREAIGDLKEMRIAGLQDRADRVLRAEPVTLMVGVEDGMYVSVNFELVCINADANSLWSAFEIWKIYRLLRGVNREVPLRFGNRRCAYLSFL